MPRRRGSRAVPSIISLSFLDVFACTLGILLFVLLLVARQLTLTFNQQAVEAAMTRHQELRSQVSEVMGRIGERRQLRETMAQMELQGGADGLRQTLTTELETLHEEQLRLTNQDGALQPGQLETLGRRVQQLRDQVEQQLQIRIDDTNRFSPSPFANLSPTPGTTLRPFVFLVRSHRIVDLWNLREFPHSRAPDSPWQIILQDLLASQDSVYPLLLVEPNQEAVMMSEVLLQDMRQGVGLRRVGLEPLSTPWRPAVDEALRQMEPGGRP